MAENSNKAAGAIGVTTAIAIVAAVAANIKPIVEGLRALWLLLVDFTKDAPAGVGAFFLALALAVLVQPYLRRWLPKLSVKCPISIDFFVETAAVLVGVVVVLGQSWTFKAGLVGLVAGLLAIPLQKGLEAVWNLGARLIKGSGA